MPKTGHVVETFHSANGPIVLRYPKDGDAPALLDYINTLSAEQTYILRQGEQLTLEQEQEWLEGLLQAICHGTSIYLFLEHEGRVVGSAHVDRKVHAEDHIGEFGITIAQDFRGMGLGRRLMRAALTEAETHFDGLRIIKLDVFANNSRAHALYKREGFVEHGRLPGGVLHRGEYVDLVHMHKVLPEDPASQ